MSVIFPISLIIWHFSEKNAQTKEEQMMEVVHLDMEFVVHVSTSLGRDFYIESFITDNI